MRFISKLNNITKVFLLAIYCIVLIVITTTVIKAVDINKEFVDYGVTPSDEYIDLAVQYVEYRTKSTNSETSVYKLAIYGIKKDATTSISNIRVFVTGVNSEGMYYKQASKTSLSASTTTAKLGPSSSITSSSSSTSISFERKTTYSSSDKTYTYTNGIPEEIFIKFIYDVEIGEETKTQTILYRTKVPVIEESKFVDAVNVDVINDNASINKGYLNEFDNFVFTKAVFTPSETSNEKIQLTFKLNESALQLNESEIQNVNYHIIGKIDNIKEGSESFFNQYCLINSLNGKINKNISLSNLSFSISNEYNLEKVYLVIDIIYENGDNVKKVLVADVNSLIA